MPLSAHVGLSALSALGVCQRRVVKTLGIGIGAIDHPFSALESERLIPLECLRDGTCIFFNAPGQNVPILQSHACALRQKRQHWVTSVTQ